MASGRDVPMGMSREPRPGRRDVIIDSALDSTGAAMGEVVRLYEARFGHAPDMERVGRLVAAIDEHRLYDSALNRPTGPSGGQLGEVAAVGVLPIGDSEGTESDLGLGTTEWMPRILSDRSSSLSSGEPSLWEEVCRDVDEETWRRGSLDQVAAAGLHYTDTGLYVASRKVPLPENMLYHPALLAVRPQLLAARCEICGVLDNYSHNCRAPSAAMRRDYVIRTYMTADAPVLLSDPAILTNSRVRERMRRNALDDPQIVKKTNPEQRVYRSFVPRMAKWESQEFWKFDNNHDLKMGVRDVEKFNFLGIGSRKLETLFLFHKIKLQAVDLHVYRKNEPTFGHNSHDIGALMTELYTLVRKLHPSTKLPNLDRTKRDLLQESISTRQRIFQLYQSAAQRAYLNLSRLLDQSYKNFDPEKYSEMYWAFYAQAHGIAGLLNKELATTIEQTDHFHRISGVKAETSRRGPCDHRLNRFEYDLVIQ